MQDAIVTVQRTTELLTLSFLLSKLAVQSLGKPIFSMQQGASSVAQIRFLSHKNSLIKKLVDAAIQDPEFDPSELLDNRGEVQDEGRARSDSTKVVGDTLQCVLSGLCISYKPHCFSQVVYMLRPPADVDLKALFEDGPKEIQPGRQERVYTVADALAFLPGNASINLKGCEADLQSFHTGNRIALLFDSIELTHAAATATNDFNLAIASLRVQDDAAVICDPINLAIVATIGKVDRGHEIKHFSVKIDPLSLALNRESVSKLSKIIAEQVEASKLVAEALLTGQMTDLTSTAAVTPQQARAPSPGEISSSPQDPAPGKTTRTRRSGTLSALPEELTPRLEVLQQHLERSAQLLRTVRRFSVASESLSTQDVSEIARRMRDVETGVPCRRYKNAFSKRPTLFSGQEAVTWLVASLNLTSRVAGVQIAQALMEQRVFEHVGKKPMFVDDSVDYRFCKDTFETGAHDEAEEDIRSALEHVEQELTAAFGHAAEFHAMAISAVENVGGAEPEP